MSPCCAPSGGAGRQLPRAEAGAVAAVALEDAGTVPQQPVDAESASVQETGAAGDAIADVARPRPIAQTARSADALGLNPQPPPQKKTHKEEKFTNQNQQT